MIFFVFLQEELGIACELLESDFLKCSVGFPFMRSKSTVTLSYLHLQNNVIYLCVQGVAGKSTALLNVCDWFFL